MAAAVVASFRDLALPAGTVLLCGAPLSKSARPLSPTLQAAIESDDDAHYCDERESDEHCCERALHFLQWLNNRPEKCIAVVTHSSFLAALFNTALHLTDEQALTVGAWFANAECRHLVLASMPAESARGAAQET